MDIISNCYRWHTNVIKENSEVRHEKQFVQDSSFWYGPGTLLYRYLVLNGIHPQGYRAIPYYVVRKEVETYGLHSIRDWKDISQFSREWYDSVLNGKNTTSVLDKYKNEKLI
jgi:hypothetical protein